MRKTVKGVQRKYGRAVQANNTKAKAFYRDLLEVLKYKWTPVGEAVAIESEVLVCS